MALPARFIKGGMQCLETFFSRTFCATAVNIPRSCKALVYAEYGDPTKVVRYKTFKIQVKYNKGPTPHQLFCFSAPGGGEGVKQGARGGYSPSAVRVGVRAKNVKVAKSLLTSDDKSVAKCKLLKTCCKLFQQVVTSQKMKSCIKPDFNRHIAM